MKHRTTTVSRVSTARRAGRGSPLCSYQSSLLEAAGSSRVLADLAVLHDEIHALEHAHVVERIAGHSDDVGECSGGDRAVDSGFTEQHGGVYRGRLNCLHGSQ